MKPTDMDLINIQWCLARRDAVALHEALHTKMQLHRRLLCGFASLFSIYVRQPVGLAASTGQTDAVVLLLASGFDPNQTGPDNLTPLHHSAIWNDVQMAMALLDHGATIQLKGGVSPLHFARAAGYLDWADAVLERVGEVADLPLPKGLVLVRTGDGRFKFAKR